MVGRKGSGRRFEMRKVVLTITLFAIFIMVQLNNVQVFAQETPQYFEETMKTADNCPVSRLYASRMYIPVMIKEFHDPTPNWQVTSVSLTNNTKSLAQMNGDDKYAFLISTNSTDQFNFRTVASYTDGLEHQIFVEYWSQNQQIAIEQFSTVKGYFCRDFMVDTALPPLQPDIPKAIEEAQAGKFQQLIDAVLESVATVNGLLVVVPASIGIISIILLVFMIYHRNEEQNVKDLTKKIKFVSSEQNKNMAEVRMLTQHIILSEKARDENQHKSEERISFLIKGVNQTMSGWSDQFTNTFRNMLLESGLFNKEQVEKVEIEKFAPVSDEQQKTEETITITEDDLEPPELKEKKDVSVKRKLFGFLEKRKVELVIWTKDQWKEYYRRKGYDKKKILEIYKRRTPYTQKNYMIDNNAKNQYDALFELYQEMDEKK